MCDIRRHRAGKHAGCERRQAGAVLHGRDAGEPAGGGPEAYRLERLLSALAKVDLLIVGGLGYLSFSRSGAELLFQVFADRYERGSILITSNLPFGEWGSVFQGERMTAALLDRFTHRCHIFEMNGESYRFRGSSKQAKEKKTPAARPRLRLAPSP